jgi:hypothetical protein
MSPSIRLASWLLAAVGLGVAAVVGGDDKAAGPRPLSRAHAHNDYRHPRPLLDAFDHGFTSVEADVFLVAGELLVGHERSELRRERTLAALYLEPLRARVRANGGAVFKGGGEFTLLVDIKDDGEATYRALHELLAGYAEILVKVRGQKLEKGAVRVVISGNRPRELMARQELRYAGVDGRLEDLESKEPSHFLPILSDHWGRHFRWRGEGPMPDAERKKLAEIVAKAHAAGRRLRFWATPERPELWKVLYDAGVDLINTDDLSGLRRFLESQESSKRGGAGEELEKPATCE